MTNEKLVKIFSVQYDAFLKRTRTIISLQNRNTTFDFLRCHVHTRILTGRRIETYFRSHRIDYLEQRC